MVIFLFELVPVLLRMGSKLQRVDVYASARELSVHYPRPFFNFSLLPEETSRVITCVVARSSTDK